MHDAWRWLSLTLGGSAALLMVAPGTLAFDQNKPGRKPPEHFALDVKEPRNLSPQARKGKKFYRANCQSCHGPTTRGSAKGPPLIIYERSNHGDEMFRDAVRNGVTEHHWKYGDMPPIKNASDQDIANLISYVRALQEFQEQQDDE